MIYVFYMLNILTETIYQHYYKEVTKHSEYIDSHLKNNHAMTRQGTDNNHVLKFYILLRICT